VCHFRRIVAWRAHRVVHEIGAKRVFGGSSVGARIAEEVRRHFLQEIHCNDDESKIVVLGGMCIDALCRGVQ